GSVFSTWYLAISCFAFTNIVLSLKQSQILITKYRLQLFIQRRLAPAADPHMPAALRFVSNARRSAAGAYHHDVRDGDGRFLLRDSALDVALRIRTHVLLHHHHVFHQHFAGAGENPQHAALLAFVTSGDDLHRVIALDIDSCMHCLPSTIWRPVYSSAGK